MSRIKRNIVQDSLSLSMPSHNTTVSGRWLTLHHAPVSCVSDGVDVRWHFMSLLALVHVDNLLWVDGQVLVGVYDDTEETGVCLQNRERWHFRKRSTSCGRRKQNKRLQWKNTASKNVVWPTNWTCVNTTNESPKDFLVISIMKWLCHTLIYAEVWVLPIKRRSNTWFNNKASPPPPKPSSTFLMNWFVTLLRYVIATPPCCEFKLMSDLGFVRLVSQIGSEANFKTLPFCKLPQNLQLQISPPLCLAALPFQHLCTRHLCLYCTAASPWERGRLQTTEGPGASQADCSRGSLEGNREGTRRCVDMTGSRRSVKGSKSLPGQGMGVNNINYRGSNSSYNTFYIPRPSVQRAPPPSSRNAALHISNALGCIVPLNFLFTRYLQTEGEGKKKESKQERDRWRGRRENARRLGARTMFLCSGNLHTTDCPKQWRLMIIRRFDREMNWFGGWPWKILFCRTMGI